jgi:hypothetical protein
MMFATILLYLEKPYLDGVSWADTFMGAHSSHIVDRVSWAQMYSVVMGAHSSIVWIFCEFIV